MVRHPKFAWLILVAQLRSWREGDAPEILHRIGFKKLHSIGIESLCCTRLCDNLGRGSNVPIVFDYDDRIDRQIAIEMESSSISVQVSGSGGEVESTSLNIFPGYLQRGGQRNTLGSASRYRNAAGN